MASDDFSKGLGLDPQTAGDVGDDSTATVIELSGVIKWFDVSKGYGFIAPEGGGKDVFVHATAVEAAGLRSLTEGQKVSFDVVPDARGAKAANLKAV